MSINAIAQTKGQLKFSSKSPEATMLLRDAWAAMADAKLEDAKDMIAKVREKDPDFALPYLFIIADSDEEYRENIKKAASLKASADERLMINAQMAFVDKTSTLAFYEPLVKKYPKDNYVQLLTALGLKNSKEDKRSLEVLQALVSRDPSFAPAHNLLGYGYMDMNEMDKAKESFDKYMSLRPDLPNVYDSKGDYFLRTGQLEAAAEMFEKAAAMDPRNMNFSKNKADRTRNRIREEKIMADVKPVFNQLLKAAGAKEAEEFFSFYHFSADFLAMENGRSMGSKEFKENITNIFNSISGIKFNGNDSYIVIDENAVIASFVGGIEVRQNDGGVQRFENFTLSMTFEKVNDEWKVVHSHESYPEK
jgi:tetratricopeptide (TPR) repeat protein